MKLIVYLAALLPALPRIVQSTFIEPRTAKCSVLSFQVTASAINKNYTSIVGDVTNATKLTLDITTGIFEDVPVSGTETIVARYCEPAVENMHYDTLQFIVHAITTNKLYWSGLGYPGYHGNNYSWIAYASEKGYPTLSIDRLGNGNSSHPDPILVVQAPYEIALYHTLIQSIKAGTTGQSMRTFSDIVFVGHSAGSVLGNELLATYPGDFSKAILTGFSLTILPSLPGATLTLVIPAAIQDPARFGNLPAGYLAMSSQVGRTNFLFSSSRSGIDYDPEAAVLAFTTEDTVSVGQLISAYAGIVPAALYTGSVLVLTGEEDEAFCGPGSVVIAPANCGSLLADTKTLFPSSDFSWHAIPNSGHFPVMEYHQTNAFKVAHEFLAGKSFSG